jgi:hypothetical protein
MGVGESGGLLAVRARLRDLLRAEYTALYWKCLVRTRLHRFAPPHLLKLEPDER